MESKFKQWCPTIPPILTKPVIITCWIQKGRSQRMTFEIQVQTWDRHSSVTGLYQIMVSQLSSHYCLYPTRYFVIASLSLLTLSKMLNECTAQAYTFNLKIHCDFSFSIFHLRNLKWNTVRNRVLLSTIWNEERNRTQKANTVCNTGPNKNKWWIQVLAKGKQFLLLIKHRPCYSYIDQMEIIKNSDEFEK